MKLAKFCFSLHKKLNIRSYQCGKATIFWFAPSPTPPPPPIGILEKLEAEYLYMLAARKCIAKLRRAEIRAEVDSSFRKPTGSCHACGYGILGDAPSLVSASEKLLLQQNCKETSGKPLIDYLLSRIHIPPQVWQNEYFLVPPLPFFPKLSWLLENALIN